VRGPEPSAYQKRKKPEGRSKSGLVKKKMRGRDLGRSIPGVARLQRRVEGKEKTRSKKSTEVSSVKSKKERSKSKRRAAVEHSRCWILEKEGKKEEERRGRTKP